jgi:hypothetical protein
MLIMGQLKKRTPSMNRKIQISRFIGNYRLKGKNGAGTDL